MGIFVCGVFVWEFYIECLGIRVFRFFCMLKFKIGCVMEFDC